MSLRIGFLVVLLVAVALATAAGDIGAQVLLNELMADPLFDWDGSGVYSSRDDEWVEIVNVGAAPVSLEGYRLASADTTWRYEFAGVLNPGEVRVVYGGASYQWEQANDEPLYGLRLNNTGGTLLLMRTTEGAPILVDAYTYLDLEAEDDRSSGRAPDGGPTWRLFDGMNPYSGSGLPASTGCSPSPGALLDCPTDSDVESWGAIKLKFLREPR
jgi:hypothetical protein